MHQYEINRDVGQKVAHSTYNVECARIGRNDDVGEQHWTTTRISIDSCAMCGHLTNNIEDSHGKRYQAQVFGMSV